MQPPPRNNAAVRGRPGKSTHVAGSCDRQISVVTNAATVRSGEGFRMKTTKASRRVLGTDLPEVESAKATILIGVTVSVWPTPWKVLNVVCCGSRLLALVETTLSLLSQATSGPKIEVRKTQESLGGGAQCGNRNVETPVKVLG